MDEELKELLRQNLAVSEEIRGMTKKISSYMKWNKIMNAVKLGIILLPLIAAVLYLGPLVEMLRSMYEGLLPNSL